MINHSNLGPDLDVYTWSTNMHDSSNKRINILKYTQHYNFIIIIGIINTEEAISYLYEVGY